MPESREYDVIVIGAGPTGENVADRAVKGGPFGRDRRIGTGRRRVLVLGVHAEQGSLAADAGVARARSGWAGRARR